MDIRTFGQTQRILRRDNSRLTHEVERLRAENARLTNELDLRIRQLMDVSRHCGQLLTANEELRAELDAERNAHNATAAQLYAELAEARAELDAMRQAHSVIVGRMEAMGC